MTKETNFLKPFYRHRHTLNRYRNDLKYSKCEDKINLEKDRKGSSTTSNGQPLIVIGSVTVSLRIAVDFKHYCLIGFDFMRKIEEYDS
ncbi:hypothetical protein BpHYR1_023278 [Brachionus plicatilis]|uniref:Uncharacterized protein n=1 Tax=Brachionus plicatilis TaxID=10195 RepID=A0A3M7Q5Y4_BRAPC|nr:hypothetical protein BpHYR1_023278 [Brachionus plicatilis]